jgi:hypothetical protein
MRTLTFTLTVDIKPWFDREMSDEEWTAYIMNHFIKGAGLIGPDDELTQVNGYELTLTAINQNTEKP